MVCTYPTLAPTHQHFLRSLVEASQYPLKTRWTQQKNERQWPVHGSNPDFSLWNLARKPLGPASLKVHDGPASNQSQFFSVLTLTEMFVPSQVWLSAASLNPSKQEHSKDPGLLWHIWEHCATPLVHSSISAGEGIRINMVIITTVIIVCILNIHSISILIDELF